MESSDLPVRFCRTDRCLSEPLELSTQILWVGVMDHLNEIAGEELQAALNNVEGTKPTQRLLATIAYKNGLTQTELTEWDGVQRRTICSWLE